MLDHVALNVRDTEAARAFYTHALGPLGIRVLMEVGPMRGMGDADFPYFWFGERGEPSTPVHVALRAPDRETVDAFHRAGLEAGGTDNGAPGVRPQYHQHYYAAFVLDPDGNNIEAVCHTPVQ